MNVLLNISARHVHLTLDSVQKLFGGSLHIKNKLNQIGQFAAQEVVSIVCGDKVIENVRVVGPVRDYNQVELSSYDARILGINPPVRRSGDLKDASLVTIKTDLGSITGNFAIIADRHIHFSPLDAQNYGVNDGDLLHIEIGGEKGGIMDAHAKVSDDGFFEAHLDTCDANAFLVKPGDIGVLKK